MDFCFSGVTDIGTSRSGNQDSFCVKKVSTPIGQCVLAVVCDGMGGLEKGEVASASVTSAWIRWNEESLARFLSEDDIAEKLQTEWTEQIREYSEKIKRYGQARGIRIGTTITALVLTPARYYLIHVGDSRAYEISEAVRQLTHDQTLVAREIEQGILSPEDAENDPRRSILLQCVGASDQVSPEFRSGRIDSNAVYLLCSDGFRHQITSQEIFQSLSPNLLTDSAAIKRQLEKLIQMNMSRGEQDNITALAIRTKG